jgi:hypothetical protein
MKLLSFIREKAEVHRVWLGGTREEHRRNKGRRYKALLGQNEKNAVFFGEERKKM